MSLNKGLPPMAYFWIAWLLAGLGTMSVAGARA